MLTNENRDLMITFGGLVFATIGYVNSRKAKRLYKSGIKVEGVVFSVERDMKLASGTSYYPVIRFVTDNKEWVTQKYNVSTIPRYKEGDKVNVIYNPDNTTEFILDDLATKVVGYFFWLGIVLIAIGAGLFALQL